MIAGSCVDLSLVDAGLAINTDIEHINAKHGIEIVKHNKLKHEFKWAFVD